MMEFKVHLRIESNKYYITYNKKKITMKSLPKIFPKFTREVLDILHEGGGKIINEISGRLIEFPTKEDAQNVADKLLSKIISDKLF